MLRKPFTPEDNGTPSEEDLKRIEKFLDELSEIEDLTIEKIKQSAVEWQKKLQKNNK